MMKARALAALLVLVPPPAFAETAFEPGQWQHDTRLIKASVPGVP
jgi:hypothetical protein